MDDLIPHDLRCPRCRAAVRAGAPWCTQCYAALRPEPAAVPAPAPAEVPPVVLTGAPVPASTLPLPRHAAAAAWPCATCGAVNPIEDAACASCGAGFLAELRAGEGPLLALPGIGDVVALTRAQRLGLGAAVVVALMALLVLVGLLTS